MKVLIIAEDGPPTSGWGTYREQLLQSLRAAGYEAETLHGLGYSLGNPLSYLSLVRHIVRLQRTIDAYKPDVIHIVVEPYALLVPLLHTGKAAVVLTVHGTYCYPPALARASMRFLYRTLFQRALNKTGAVVAVSSYTRNVVIERLRAARVFVDQRKLHVIENGVDTTQFTYSDHVPNTPPIILTVAPVKARKGIRESIEALAVLMRRGVDFRYRIVGGHDPESSYGRDVAARISRYGMSERVTFLGRLPVEDLEREYRQADVFLMLPIQSDKKFEGFGLVYLEANASGTPAVGARDSGAADAIGHGESGMLVDASDPEGVADAVVGIISGSISRADARRWAESHDIRSFGQKCIALYQTLTK